MRKRSISIIILVVAFLVSAWGNVIAAAFCPRYLCNRDNIKHASRQLQQVDHESSCHHEIAQMEMGDMQMEDTESEGAAEATDNAIAENRPTEKAAEFFADQVAINLPTEPCGHCWIHSQPASGTAILCAVDPSKRTVETSAPPAGFAVAVRSAFAAPITPFEHGPPGNSFPRHILINVFRI